MADVHPAPHPCTFLATKTSFEKEGKDFGDRLLKKKPTKLFYGKNVKAGAKVPVRRFVTLARGQNVKSEQESGGERTTLDPHVCCELEVD